MRKFILVSAAALAVMALAITPAENVARARCKARMRAYTELLKTNKEVQFVFSGFIAATVEFAKAKGVELDENKLVEALAQRMVDICLADESKKVEI